MKEPTLEELKESIKKNESRLKRIEKDYQEEIKQLDMFEKEIKENKSFCETSNILADLYKKNGTPVNFVVYTKSTNKLQTICNSEPLNISRDGMDSSVKVGLMIFPLCGNDCVKEITNSKTGEVLFSNDYYNQSYHLQRAQVFGTHDALKGTKREKLSAFEFRNVLSADIEKINNSLSSKIESLNAAKAPSLKA